MKTKIMILTCLACIVFFVLGYEKNPAEAATPVKSSVKVGVISVRDVFGKCQRNIKYQQDAAAEREKLEAELNKIKAEIEAAEAGLKTLKPDSDEYMSQAQQVWMKRSGFEAQKEFYQRQLELKDRRWAEKLYQDILRFVTELAQQKELLMVFEKDEPMLPTESSQDLWMAIRMHKLLYASSDCIDISEEIQMKVDAGN